VNFESKSPDPGNGGEHVRGNLIVCLIFLAIRHTYAIQRLLNISDSERQPHSGNKIPFAKVEYICSASKIVAMQIWVEKIKSKN